MTRRERRLYYQWIVLFLDQAESVYIFIHLLLLIVKHLRACGWEGIINIYECQYWKMFAGDILARAGWVVNESKDQEPAQDNILLGSKVNTIDLKFRIPMAKIEEIKELIQDALSRNYLHVKFVACIVGKRISF